MTSTTSSSSSASSSSSSGSGGGGNCGVMQHSCGGVCVGNTPDTGCFSDPTCVPCSTPANGTSSCTNSGQCDFSCDAGYNKQGASCVCGASCCIDADCPGGTCQGGMCVAAMMCDPVLCIAICVIQMKLGVCNGNVCTCL